MDLDHARHSMVLDLGLLFAPIWLFLGLGVNTVFEGSGDCVNVQISSGPSCSKHR